MAGVDVVEAKASLAMADREWANNGLIATDNKNDGGTHEMMRHLDAYRGQYDRSFGSAIDLADEMVGNMLFSLMNTFVSQISARDPEPIIRPSGGTAANEDAWRRAWMNQKIVQAMIREKKFKREMDRALYSSLLSPFGFVRHGFTADPDEFSDKDGNIHARHKNQTPEMPWIQFLRPWEVRIDPLVNHFDMDGEARWVAFRNLYTKRQIMSNPALIMRKDWVPTFHEDLRPMHERHKPVATHSGEFRAGMTGPNKPTMSLYEEWVMYDASTKTFFGISPGSDSLVREEMDWPLDWGQLPGSIITMNEQMDSPFGVPFPRMIWSEQEMFNKVWTTLNVLVNRTRRLLFVNRDAFASETGQLENLLNPQSMVEAIVHSGNPAEVVKEVGVGSIDGQLVGLLFQLKEQIREVLGISSFDRGQRANVETASEANQIGAGGQANRSRTQAKFEGFWVDVIRASHRALLQSEQAGDFVVPLVGEENFIFLTQGEIASGFVEIGVGELGGEFDYGVKMNSTLPHDPAAELNQTHVVYTALGGAQSQLANHVYFSKRMALLGGMDPNVAIVPQEVAEKMGENAPEGEGPQSQGQASPPQGVPAASGVPGVGN